MIRPSLLFRPLQFCLLLAGLVLFAGNAAAVTFEKRTAASTDDAEEFLSDGSIYISSTDLELIHDTSDQVVGMRWTGVAIPQGATITAAYVQFWAKESQTEVTNLVFNGQAADNAATFNTTHLSISTRPRTAANTTWPNVAAWTSTSGQGANQRTPSLVSVIQEIVNRPGWASGNAMVIVVTGTGHRCAYAWDGSTTQSPLLHIEYTTAAVNNAPVARLSVTQSATPPLTVNANGSASTDTDAFPIASYKFDFGDGTPTVTANAPSATASHAYATAGTYTVSLICTDTGNLSSPPATQSITVQAENPPVAQLAVSQPPTPPLTVNATAAGSSDGDLTPIASYRFDFGDGTPTVTVNAPTVTASHAYASAGPYTVSLIAVDTGGNASAAVSRGITIQPENPPAATLAVSQLASPSLTVKADAAGSTDGDLTPIASYRFDFGDGTATVTVNAPTTTANHTYASQGTYTVTLIAVDTGGNASTPATQSIQVLPQDDPPVARLAVTQPATPPLTVNADGSASTDGDLTPIATYAFDFGDGTPTVTANAPTATASHAYAAAGPYTITLIATDTGGKASAPVTKSITIQAENPPVAHLSLSQPATPPLTVVANGSTSTDADLTPIASYAFDFGDGTPTVTANAPTATATHDYATAGGHTVTLIVTDTGGNASSPVSQEIFVQADDPPIASLVLSQAASPFLTANADGSFSSDGDLTPIASYRFDFGDGTPTVTVNAPTATAKHTYASAGNYFVTLVCTDTGGLSSEPATEAITIEGPTEAPPVAQLTVTRAPVPTLQVNADASGSTDTDLTPIASYAFDFGDGTPTVTANAPTATASHTYATLGTYTVTLIVTDTGGFSSAPATQSINVLPPDDPPVARLSVAQPATPALTVNADGSTSTDTDFTPIASYRFDFGDGTPTVTANAPTSTASHTYASAGPYTVTLIAVDTGGNASAPVTKSITVVADNPPTAQLVVNQVPIPPLTVSADASGSTDADLTPIATYRFEFGDGTPTVTANAPTATASHTYLLPGTYTVKLIVTDTGGFSSAPATQSINVGADAPPTARLSLSQPPTPPLEVNADGSASTDGDLTPIATYRFDFGDGTATVTATAPTATASHAYAAAGTYTVTLIATDTGGNASTPATQSITVQAENPPVAQLAVSQPSTPPLTVNATAAGSTDGDLTPIASYRFQFGDGTPTVTVNAPTVTASHAYATGGAYTVTLIAVDTGGFASAPATRSITVQADAPPVARLSVTQPPAPPLTVNADGSASTDADLTPIATYRFNFGDGTATVTATAPTATASHVYAAGGSYTVTLIAVDTGGFSSAPATQSITVQAEAPPVARLSVTQPPTPPLTVNASGATSTDADLTPIATYRFNFGDGTATVTATAPSSTASHVYATAGTYTVTLICTDTGGFASAPATQSITVQAEAPPVARLTATANATPGLVVTADGSTSTDGDLTPIASYRFSFGDGTATVTTNAPTASTQHTYAAAGTYTVTLIVTDTANLSSAGATASVTVSNAVAPIDKRTIASSDDAEESNGAVNLTSSDLELIHDSADQVVGIRWTGINIPKNATINSAYIQFGAKEAQSEVTNLTIRGEAADNSATYTTASSNVTARTRTTSYVKWNPVAWSSTDGQGANQRTPDLAFPIQQIVNRAGWVSGNALSMIINGTGHRTAWAFDGSAANCPLLHIVYNSGPAPPQQAPVAQLSVAAVGMTANADGSASTDGDLTPIASYRFTFGDGTAAVVVNAPNATTSHTYSTAGTYTVSLTCTDTGGLTSAPVTQSVTVSGGTGGGGSGVAVYVGYYDTHHTDQLKSKPNPWKGAAGVTFVGTLDPGTTNGWDTSAIRIDNLGTSALTGVNATVDMGSHHFALWTAQSIPAGGSLILAQTGFENFDGSDTSPAGCYSCDPNDCLTKVSNAIPVVHLTIGSTTTNYNDTGQIMNTHGVDQAGCPYTGTRNDESSNWVRVFTQTGAPSARALDTVMSEPVTPKLSWLSPPFPNPSHGALEVRFRTNYGSHFRLAVYDISGRLQKQLSEPDLDPGDYLEQLSLSGLPAGMYYLAISSPQGSMRHPFVLVR